MTLQPPSTAQSGPFPLLAVAALLALGIVGFCAFLVAAAYAPEMRRDERGGGTALSDSAVGFAGLVEQLEAMDVPVTINRLDLAHAGSGLLVLTPPPRKLAVDPAQAREAAAVLIVLPKWDVSPLREHPGWVERAGLIGADDVASVPPSPVVLVRRPGRRETVLHGGGQPFSDEAGLALGPISDMQVIDTDKAVRSWTPLLLDEDGATVLARLTRPGTRPTYVLSDPDLLDTQGLKTLATARTAATIVDRLRGDTRVVFDVTLNGLGHAPNLLRLLFEPPVLGATLCSAAAALLILAMAVRRFGPAVPPARVLDFGKRALADSAAGLIAIAGREHRMTLPYAELIRARALRDLGIPPRLERGEAERLLDAAARSRGVSSVYADLAGEATKAKTRTAALAAARHVFDWGKGLQRGSR